MPSYIAGIKPENLPCGGCNYCKRADRQWGEFSLEVDDVTALTGSKTCGDKGYLVGTNNVATLDPQGRLGDSSPIEPP
ncbi:hypothetical protein CI610_02835 [invertebrate metagenome]|uniref:Uncharacterized protein n=1 Tax=invertebrate metagenome TaxID=1711999 RepID=A0A2H9T4U5_9ZZZZ